MLIMGAVACALLAAGAGYSLSLLVGARASIRNASIVNGGATLRGTTVTALGSRVGPPIHRLRTNLTTAQLEAEGWQRYQ